MDGNSQIRQLRQARQETLRRFAALDQSQLEQERPWRGAPSNLRFRLSWLSEGSEARRMLMLGIGRRLGRTRLTDAQHALGVACETRGRLLGALVGVPDALFERSPAEGEWSIRQILGHVIATDIRYAIAVRHAVDRAKSGGTGPMRPPPESLPPTSGEAQSTGTPAELLQRLQAVRDTEVTPLSSISDDLLSAPTQWVSWDIDVRFRLHRFAAHDREHTIQIRKALNALGFMQTEAQMLLADAMAESGALEAVIRSFDPALLEREPPGGGPSITQLIEGILEDERAS